MLTNSRRLLIILQVSRCVFGLAHDFQLLHHRLSLPAGYATYDVAPQSDQELRLTIAMPQVNESGLYAALLDASDPASENYGRHLSAAEVGSLPVPLHHRSSPRY